MSKIHDINMHSTIQELKYIDKNWDPGRQESGLGFVRYKKSFMLDMYAYLSREGLRGLSASDIITPNNAIKENYDIFESQKFKTIEGDIGVNKNQYASIIPHFSMVLSTPLRVDRTTVLIK